MGVAPGERLGARRRLTMLAVPWVSRGVWLTRWSLGILTCLLIVIQHSWEIDVGFRDVDRNVSSTRRMVNASGVRQSGIDSQVASRKWIDTSLHGTL